MNLHTIPETQPEPAEVTAENVACPECGERRFCERVYGRYSETNFRNYDRPTAWANYEDNWDNLDQDVEDGDGWECVQGHVLPVEIQDFLNDD